MSDQVAEVSATYLVEAADKGLPMGYKQTEVGVIPEDWDVQAGRQLFTKIQDGTHFSPKISGGEYLYITSKNIKFGFLDFKSAEYIDRLQHEAIYNRCDVKKNDILLTKDGAKTGNAALNTLDEQFSLLSSVAFLRLDKNKDCPAFFLQQILSDEFQNYIKEEMSGNAITRLTLKKINGLKFYVPCKIEQTAIANALSDVDELISELEKLIAKKQAIKTASMQQLLTGRTRLPQFALHEDGTPKGYKKSELGEIPEDWDAIKMSELARIQRGASPRPIDSPVWFNRNSSVGWLRISDVSKTNKYLTETTQSLSELGIANSRFVSKNNLVMSICATVGKPIITKKDLCIHDGFVVFNGLSANQDLMYYILKELEDKWGKQGQTGSQMNLNTDLINGTYIAIPGDEQEQAAIATIFSDMDEEIQALEQRLGKTRQIKQGMMQELLTGKTRLVAPAV
jgi:type I restriction enzyme S subunit|tara:strand:+ start:834 stop:2195 length:1362 start_codon:yes stop_codon:yes gene_type:complete